MSTILTELLDKIYDACPELILRGPDDRVIQRSPIHLEHVLKTAYLLQGRPLKVNLTSWLMWIEYDLTKTFYAQEDAILSAINEVLWQPSKTSSTEPSHSTLTWDPTTYSVPPKWAKIATPYGKSIVDDYVRFLNNQAPTGLDESPSETETNSTPSLNS